MNIASRIKDEFHIMDFFTESFQHYYVFVKKLNAAFVKGAKNYIILDAEISKKNHFTKNRCPVLNLNHYKNRKLYK